MSGKVYEAQGRVRRVAFDETDKAGVYARITLAGDPERYMDFDAPDEWEDLRGTWVHLQWVESENVVSGFTYRRVLDVWQEGED